MKKAVIAIDSFKGCLSSSEAGKAVEAGIKSIFPACETILFPVADGGEGLLEALVPATHGSYHSLQVHGPLMKPIQCQYATLNQQQVVIEMAHVCGLPLIPKAKRNPMQTTTYGMGELIRNALDQGYRQFLIGIGGSGTNDAGVGMLQALGFHFLNKKGERLGIGGQILSEIESIDTSNVHPALHEARFTIACDVQNPFCGPNGAAYVFASQKGADLEMIHQLDAGMNSFAKVIHQYTGKDILNIPGAGAAGGIGGCFLAFLHATLQPGIQLILETLHFAEQIQDADLIITGEGKADKQTLMGKVPFGILEVARQINIPVILLAGSIADREQLQHAGFQGVFSITPGPISLEEAIRPTFTQENLRQMTAQLCLLIRSIKNFSSHQ